MILNLFPVDYTYVISVSLKTILLLFIQIFVVHKCKWLERTWLLVRIIFSYSNQRNNIIKLFKTFGEMSTDTYVEIIVRCGLYFRNWSEQNIVYVDHLLLFSNLFIELAIYRLLLHNKCNYFHSLSKYSIGG